MAENNEVRLDKWLWAARFYKTRSIAKAMIEGGKVHYLSLIHISEPTRP